MIVVGVDPGKSFGVVVLRDTRIILVSQGTAERGLAVINFAMHSREDVREPIVVACESFVVTPRGGRRTGIADTSELVGAVKQLVSQQENVTLYMQSSSDAKHSFPNKLLRQLYFYVTPSMVFQADADDANSAMRHALLCLANHHATVFETLVNGSRSI
jgi:hypothetical protein